jgi:iron complex outermembrane recepter protein
MRIQLKSATLIKVAESHSKYRSAVHGLLLCALTAVATLSSLSTAFAADNAPTVSSSAEEQGVLAEIVVTATKRETNLQLTPAAISVVSADEISQRGLVGMDDYLAGLPGVSYQDRGASSNSITIRGIGLGSQLDSNSPVGSYFGEVPVTGLGSPLNGNQAGNADIKMVDIEQVEVSRGPQGTLWGSGSMGGLVRVIPKAPNLTKVEGTLSVDDSVTARYGGNNHMEQAVINAPLIQDKLAVRVVAYRFDNDGYIKNVAASDPIDNVTTAVNAGAIAANQDHVGGDVYKGVRLTALWRPIDNFSATLMTMDQQINQDGGRQVQTNLPGLYQQSLVQIGPQGTNGEYVKTDLGITNLVLEYDLGWGHILNSTSYADSRASSDIELTFYGPPFIGEGAYNQSDTKQTVNELRFTSEFAEPFQILAGLYYQNTESSVNDTIEWDAQGPGPASAYFENLVIQNTEKQYAAFGEFSYNPLEPLTITVGERYFKFKQYTPPQVSFGVPSTTPGANASVSGSTGKINISYKLNQNLFGYAQLAQGFRGPKYQPPLPAATYDPNNPGYVQFQDGIDRKPTIGFLDPDTVNNYEAGIKFRSTNGRLQASLTGFLIDWKGIPIVPSLTKYLGYGVYFNAGKAKSKGIEFDSTAELMQGLIFRLSGSWVNARLEQTVPGLGNEGDRLPGSAPYNAQAELEKRFVVAGHNTFVRADYTYVSKYFSFFEQTGQIPAGGYQTVDLSSGITFDKVTVGLFAKNATNAANFTWVDNVFGSDRAYRLVPRTIGVSASVSF